MPTAVVTGAGRGIGRAICVRLAKSGWDLGIQGRSEAPLLETQRLIEAQGRGCIVVPGDVARKEAADALVDHTQRAFGAPTCAVPCAGQAFSAPILRSDPDDLRRLLEVNLLSVLHLVQAAAPVMKSAGGAIVVVASTAAVHGARYTSAYSASKHGVLGLVRSGALDLASQGVTLNAVCPGWVDTPMFDATLDNIAEKTGGTRAEARQRIEARIPSGRVTSSEEVAGLVAYLAGPEARQVTGQAWVMDGGETLGS